MGRVWLTPRAGRASSEGQPFGVATPAVKRHRCVSSSEINLDETLNTLRYANRAKNIRNKPMVNRDPHSAQLAEMRRRLRGGTLTRLA